VLGLAAVVGAFVMWLIPTSSGTNSTSEHSTTAVTNPSGSKTSTAVDKTTTTTASGSERSATVIVALLTFGFGLVVAASLWDRIQELAVGNVSIKLVDAAVTTPGVTLIDAVAANVDSLGSTSANAIAAEVYSVSTRRLAFVQVDLRAGDLWAPLNLAFFIGLLARRSYADVIFFTSSPAAGPKAYIGVGSVTRIADRLAARDPMLALALRATDGIPLDAQVGEKFFAELEKRDPNRVQRETRELVDAKRLDTLAGTELITNSVVSEGASVLSKQQQRAVLAFPLDYVPITCQGRLESIISKPRLCERVALSVVGS
jgi:hypothetical protein